MCGKLLQHRPPVLLEQQPANPKETVRQANRTRGMKKQAIVRTLSYRSRGEVHRKRIINQKDIINILGHKGNGLSVVKNTGNFRTISCKRLRVLGL
jgi:hypothetical protein